jgi:hypothetical protein
VSIAFSTAFVSSLPARALPRLSALIALWLWVVVGVEVDVAVFDAVATDSVAIHAVDRAFTQYGNILHVTKKAPDKTRIFQFFFILYYYNIKQLCIYYI